MGAPGLTALKERQGQQVLQQEPERSTEELLRSWWPLRTREPERVAQMASQEPAAQIARS